MVPADADLDRLVWHLPHKVYNGLLIFYGEVKPVTIERREDRSITEVRVHGIRAYPVDFTERIELSEVRPVEGSE